MNPSQLVNANVTLQQLNSDIDDLALLERSQRMDSLYAHLGQAEKMQVLELARALACKAKTDHIRSRRQMLVESGVVLGEGYINNRLSECRAAALGRDEASKLSGNVRSIWGGGGGDYVNCGNFGQTAN